MQNWILKRRRLLRLISIISVLVFTIGLLLIFFGEPSEYSSYGKGYSEFFGAWISLISSVVLLISLSLYFFGRIIFNAYNSSLSGYQRFVHWWREAIIIGKYSLKYRKLINISFVLSFPFIVCGIVLINYADSQSVTHDLRDLFENVGIITIFLSFVVLSVTHMLRLRLKHEEIFRSWARFAKWYLFVYVAIMLFGSFGGGGYISSGTDDREGATIFLTVLFLLISLVLITWKWFSLRWKYKS